MGEAGDAIKEESGQELPAGADVPRGLDEASYWPFLAAISVFGVYVGAILYLLGNGEVAVIVPWLGVAVLAVAGISFLAALFGWLYHAFLLDYWERGAEDRKPLSLGFVMLLFLATDVATFAGGWGYYFYIRAGSWPPGELPGLLSPLLLLNTVALLSSSFTLHFAHSALEEGNHRRFTGLIGATFVLGVLFIAGQSFEYYEFIVGEGFTIASSPFSAAFFGLTGLHGLHVTLGTILLGIVLARSLIGHYAGGRDSSIRTVSWYWHFVDLMWVFIVSFVYVGASIGA